MTPTECLAFMERFGVNVMAGTSDTLVPQSFAVCCRGLTGWITRGTLKEALVELEREMRTMYPKEFRR